MECMVGYFAGVLVGLTIGILVTYSVNRWRTFMDIPKSTTTTGFIPKGHWRSGISAGRRSASISCPACGRIASLRNHDIDADGKVTPSLVCAYECGFHEYVILKGWKR